MSRARRRSEDGELVAELASQPDLAGGLPCKEDLVLVSGDRREGQGPSSELTATDGRHQGSLMGLRHDVVRVWDEHVAEWLAGEDPLSPTMRSWFQSYVGQGRGAVTREGFVEPYNGDLTSEEHAPRLAVLGLNPGRYHPELQSRTGTFADEIRRAGSYSAWARSAPYLREPWVGLHGPNRYFADRLRFTGRWLGITEPAPNDMLVMELYPWHSTGVTGPMRPPRAVIDRFVWGPLGELDLPLVFAFGSEWARIADQLNLPLERQLGRGGINYGSTVASRAVRLYRLPSGQQLVVEWHSGSAGPPSGAETEILRAALRPDATR